MAVDGEWYEKFSAASDGHDVLVMVRVSELATLLDAAVLPGQLRRKIGESIIRQLQKQRNDGAHEA